MNEQAKKVKAIIKNCAAPSKFGTDPSDPWSAKSNVNEAGGGSLESYLNARGINPKFLSKDAKISHAKSSQYLKWKKDHQFEEVEYINEDKYLDAYLLARGLNPKTITRDQKIAHAKSSAFLTWKRNHLHEQVDSKDTITLDIPFMIRVLEYAREDAKDDMALHKVVEKLIEIRNKGTLTMDDYDFVTTIKEQYDLTEGRMKDIVTDREEKSRLAAHERGGADAWYGRKYSNPHEIGSIEHKAYHQGYHGGEKDGKDYGAPKGKPIHSFRESALDKWRKAASERQKKHDDAEKEMKARHASGKEDMKGSIDRLEKSLNKEETEQIDELNYDTVKSLYDKRRADYHGDEVGKKKKGKEVSAKNVSRSISRLLGFKSTQNAPKSNWKPAFEEVEQIDEISKETLSSYRDKAMASNKNAKKNREASEAGKDMSKGFADLHAKSNAIVKKRIKGLSGYLQRKHGMKPGYEDQRKQTNENTLDPQAATEAPKGPGEGITETQKQRSKSARIIKSIYKRKNMKEETYDWEKDDKTPQKLGKGVKLTTTDPKDSFGANKPEARIVMSGGKTMTGEKRDTVEIDPLMAKRTTPDDFDKPIGKKDK